MFKFMSNIFPSIRSSIKKNFDSLLWMGFNSLKATEPLRGDSLLYIYQAFSFHVQDYTMQQKKFPTIQKLMTSS